MTRGEVKQLEFNFPLPKTRNGGRMLHEEIFIAPSGDKTWSDGMKKLKKIQEEHPTESGWYCPGGKCEGVFKENGEFFAYRYHAKYEMPDTEKK